MFDSVEEIRRLTDEYFRQCEGVPLLDGDGNVVRDKQMQPIFENRRIPTLCGLALALGFPDRQSLSDYVCKPAVNAALSRAKTRILCAAEQQLMNDCGYNGIKLCLAADFPDYLGGEQKTEASPIQALIKELCDD